MEDYDFSEPLLIWLYYKLILMVYDMCVLQFMYHTTQPKEDNCTD